MKINQTTEFKSIQFLGSPFRGKKAEELKAKTQEIKDTLSESTLAQQSVSGRHLISITSTKGKSPEQAAREIMEAKEKYYKTKHSQ